MKIEGIIQNINNLAVKGQVEVSADNSGNANSSQNREVSERTSSSPVRVNVGLIKEIKDKQQGKDNINTGNNLFNLKAVFALDKEKNVVIRFLDQKGKVVRQIPPEEYINMIKKFKESVENLFSKEV